MATVVVSPMSNMAVQVKVTGFKGWRWRTAFATGCFKLAAWVLGCKVEVHS